MTTHEIAFRIDVTSKSSTGTMKHLALMWHVAQANPADGFRESGPRELVERIGREIIRRWLRDAPVHLYHHQGRHYYWKICCSLGNWNTDGEFVADERAMPGVIDNVAERDS
jgi:hypothetical protein